MSDHETAPVEAQPAGEQASRWEDYIDVFFSPVALFRRRAADRLGPPLLTLLAASFVLYFILLPANTMMVRASIPPEQQAQVPEGALRIWTYVGSITVPIYFLVSAAFTAFLLWLGGRLADLRTEYSRTMLIATYAAFVLLLMQLVAGVLLLVRGSAELDVVRDLSFGPLRFVGSRDMDPVQMAVLRRFDFFYIWQAVLWAIGMRVFYRTGWGRAALIAGVTWALFILPGLVSAAFNFGRAAQGAG